MRRSATRKYSESMFVRSPRSQPCHGPFGGKLGSVRTQTSDNYREQDVSRFGFSY